MRRGAPCRNCPAVKAVLQRGGVFSLAGPVRMPGTRGRCQAADGGISLSAVFAGVLRLFRAFIGRVFPPAWSCRMPGARGCRQTPDTVVLLSAVLAIVPFHFCLLLCSFMSVACSASLLRTGTFSGHPRRRIGMMHKANPVPNLIGQRNASAFCSRIQKTITAG